MKLKFHEDSHRYYLDGKQISGVTTLAKVPEDTYRLQKWEARMVAIGVATDPQIREAIAVNYDDKKKLGELVDKAKQAAKAHAASDRGTTLHQVTERHDLGLGMIETETNIKIRKAWAAALDAEGLTADERYVERIVLYPDHKLAGTLDRVFYSTRRGALVIGDAKSGQKAINYPHSIAVQLALYANAPLLAGRLDRSGITEEFEAMPDVDKDVGYVIWMPEDDQAEVVPVDIKAGWECFNDVILPTLRWRERSDLIIRPGLGDLLEQSCGSPTTQPAQEGNACPGETLSSSPTTTPQTPAPTSAAGSKSNDATTRKATPSVNPPTTTSPRTPTATEADVKDRLAILKKDRPDLAERLKKTWPRTVPSARWPWSAEQVRAIADLIDSLGT